MHRGESLGGGADGQSSRQSHGCAGPRAVGRVGIHQAPRRSRSGSETSGLVAVSLRTAYRFAPGRPTVVTNRFRFAHVRRARPI